MTSTDSVLRGKEATCVGAAVATKRTAQSVAFSAVHDRPGAFDPHFIPLALVREEITVIGPIYCWHGDLVGIREPVAWGRRWSRRDCSALSFPASVLIGPPEYQEVPF